jgi:hypothetical protein
MGARPRPRSRRFARPGPYYSGFAPRCNALIPDRDPVRDAFTPFDFWILEARLLLTQFLRLTAPEFAATHPSIHTSHEFFRPGA